MGTHRRFSRRRSFRRGPSDVEVSQLYSLTTMAVPAGTGTGAPATDTIQIWSPNYAFAASTSAPVGLKYVKFMGCLCWTDYAVQVGVAAVSSQSQISEGFWHDSAGGSAAAPAIPLPNYFLSEVGSAVANVEATLPKRTLFRRATFLQVGAGTAASPTIPGNTQASQSSAWRAFRTKAMLVDADRGMVGHTVCATNSTAGAINIVLQRYFVVRYKYIF